MVIQQLKPSQRVAGRWLAVMEDGSILRLGENEVLNFSLYAGRELTGQEAEQLAANIEANADPRKWICVEAESKIVDFSGDTVILIMTSADLAEQLHSGFTAAVAE